MDIGDHATGRAASRTERFTGEEWLAAANFDSEIGRRLRWLASEGLLHPKIRWSVEGALRAEFVFPQDILQAIMGNEQAVEALSVRL